MSLGVLTTCMYMHPVFVWFHEGKKRVSDLWTTAPGFPEEQPVPLTFSPAPKNVFLFALFCF